MTVFPTVGRETEPARAIARAGWGEKGGLAGRVGRNVLFGPFDFVGESGESGLRVPVARPGEFPEADDSRVDVEVGPVGPGDDVPVGDVPGAFVDVVRPAERPVWAGDRFRDKFDDGGRDRGPEFVC